MSALTRVVRAGMARRRLQTMVLALTTTMAVTAAMLAAGLLVAASAPFDTAFAAERGAQLTAQFTGISAAQVDATARLSEVTASAGPFPVLMLRPVVETSAGDGPPTGNQLDPMTFVGRAQPQGPVDDLRLTEGRWATGPGEVVLGGNAPLGVGDTMTVPNLPSRPRLTVVGVAASITGSADAWVTPDALAALGARPSFQMLYRFRSASTDAQINADRAAIAAAVPSGALTSAASYLKVKVAADRLSATFVPFVTAFGVLGLVMSVLTIGIVVGGAVSAATRRIGILKAVGFAPSQVVRGYLGQALVPGTVGTLLGAVLGNLLAIPVMSDVGAAFGVGAPIIAPWLDVLVPVAALVVVAAAAAGPALRAGRLRTVAALTVGRTPSAGRGRWVRGVLGGLALPRSVSLGLATPFARPGRSAIMLAALLLGTVGVTFGAGLVLSLNAVANSLGRQAPGQVVVQLFGPTAPPAPGGASTPTKPATVADVATVIAAQPGTRRYLSTGLTRVAVAGQSGSTDVIAYQGDDTSWAALPLVAGTWFDRPGQVVVPGEFLADTGTHVGAEITLTNNGLTAKVTIVGEVFAVNDTILTDSRSLSGVDAHVLPPSVQFGIDLRPGTDLDAYLDALDTALAPYNVTAQANTGGLNPTDVGIEALAGVLTVMLLAVAGFCVLNTVALDVRERVRDFGIYQALGMSPRQTKVMVVTSVLGIGVLAGLIGVPLGIALHDQVVPAMGAAADTAVPAADLAVYQPAVLIPLLFGGAILAAAGALAPATWATRMRTATALRTE